MDHCMGPGSREATLVNIHERFCVYTAAYDGWEPPVLCPRGLAHVGRARCCCVYRVSRQDDGCNRLAKYPGACFISGLQYPQQHCCPHRRTETTCTAICHWSGISNIDLWFHDDGRSTPS